jgi:hypothetical protein
MPSLYTEYKPTLAWAVERAYQTKAVNSSAAVRHASTSSHRRRVFERRLERGWEQVPRLLVG